MPLVKTQKYIHKGKRPLHLATLNSLLIMSGVRCKWGSKKSLCEMNDGELYALKEAAHTKWKENIVKHHPDRGGDTKIAAHYNTVWKYTKKRFEKKFGI